MVIARVAGAKQSQEDQARLPRFSALIMTPSPFQGKVGMGVIPLSSIHYHKGRGVNFHL